MGEMGGREERVGIGSVAVRGPTCRGKRLSQIAKVFHRSMVSRETPLNLRNSRNNYKNFLTRGSSDQVHLLGVHQFYL